VSDRNETQRRVRFYGPHDLAAGLLVPRAAEIAEQFDAASPLTSAGDAIELHNVQQYLEHGFAPASYGENDRAGLRERAPQINSAVAHFFSTVNNANFAAIVADLPYGYHSDLLDLLGRYKAFDRCAAAIVLPALGEAGVHLSELLSSKKLVQAYDEELRQTLCASPRGAEIVIQHYFQRDTRVQTYLPHSLESSDAQKLLEGYIDSTDPNLNYVKLVATAKENRQAGVDAKLKLRAKRRADELNSAIFQGNPGIKTGCEIIVSDDQDAASLLEIDGSDGMVERYTYSRRWLEETQDHPSILNNFMHLFEFVDRQVILNLPSYPAQLGVFERFMGTTGKTEYKTGVVFRATDASSLLQTHMYNSFLAFREVQLEEVIAWFFDEYLVEEFAALNFKFSPCGAGTSHLQKVRHLFAEMESVVNQFTLYVENNEVDLDLLAMGSDQVRYKEIPSLLPGKYAYPNDSEEIRTVLHLLFSDQSHLGYISEDLKESTAAALLINQHVGYDDFNEYQKEGIDHLIGLGILQNTGTRIRLANAHQFRILYALFNVQAANYYHLPAEGRTQADAMVARGWLVRRSSLLTEAEAEYFNYFLNAVDFSNGPQLRNKYLHGAQAGADDENAHFKTYLIALRLLVALVIKINDDFNLSACESSATGDS
jgi:hypothetical protein